MAGRFQDRPFAAGDDEDPRGSRRPGARDESDPLSELARLIGQTDPFEEFGRANRPAQQADTRARHPLAPGRDEIPRAAATGRDEQPIPSWLTSANRNQQAYGSPAADDYPDDFGARAEGYRPRGSHEGSYPETDYRGGPAMDYGHGGGADYRSARADDRGAGDYAGHDRQAQGAPGASPYDDVLYGARPGETAPPRGGDGGPGRYADDEVDPYGEPAYDERENDVGRPRRGKMLAVAGVLMLAVVGTAGAYGYRNYVAAPRGGEPPVIKADNAPTKVVPAAVPTGEGSSKPIQDRVGGVGAPERIISREEQPVDVNQVARPEPRVVFPPLNQPNTNPPPPAERQAAAPPSFSQPPTGKAAADQPKRVRTVAIRGNEQGQASVTPTPSSSPPPVQAVPPPAQQPAPRMAARPVPQDDAEPQGNNAPMQLSPQRPTSARAQQQTAAVPSPAASAGGYVVQVSSQRSEQDAQASFRMLQGKFPSVLGSRSATIKRVDLGDKGVYFRAVVGPFSGSDDASRFCSDLKSAGGQCVVQRN